MEHLMLAAIGGGGKTSSLLALARAAGDRRVLLTTTTHILPVSPPASRVLLTDPDAAALLRQLALPGLVCAGTRAAEGKLGPLAPTLLAQAAAAADWTLCEADGARRLPLKLHRPGEPVIPPGTDLCLVVAGLSALGRPVSQVVHRYELEPRWLAEPDRPVGAAEVLRCVEEALRESGLPRERLRVLLNQADTPDRAAQALPVAEALRAQGIPCHIGSLARDDTFLLPWLLGR